MSERLDIGPAEFFVHRHVYGKWTCRCCQRQGIERLVREPAEPQIIDGGIAASGDMAALRAQQGPYTGPPGRKPSVGRACEGTWGNYPACEPVGWPFVDAQGGRRVTTACLSTRSTER